MRLKLIKTKAEHEAALKEADRIFDAKANTPEAERLELLGLLIEDYEERHFPFAAPDPIEAIKFRMEQQGLTTSDLAKVLGGRNRASEVLNHKRSLSLAMIRNLHKQWHIPAETLLA